MISHSARSFSGVRIVASAWSAAHRNVIGCLSEPSLNVPAISLLSALNVPVYAAVVTLDVIVTLRSRCEIATDVALPSPADQLPADVPSAPFTSFSTTGSELPPRSSDAVHSPTNALSIDAFFAGGANFASPVRSSSNGTL